MPITITPSAIPDVKIIRAKAFSDVRGTFCETYKASEWREAGIDVNFMQDNHVVTLEKFTVRALHFQAAPFAQTKLIRALQGAIYDVAVDLRVGSPTYGKSVGIELKAGDWTSFLIPAGFAHGYATLTDNAEVMYKVDNPYAPQCEGGLLWNDPALGIEWPFDVSQAKLAERDMAWPELAEFKSPF